MLKIIFEVKIYKNIRISDTTPGHVPRVPTKLRPCTRLIVYFMGGQLVFDWDRLEDFLTLAIDRTVIKTQIQYHMPKLSTTCANTVHHRL